MTYRLERIRAPELPADFLDGELLMMKPSKERKDPALFVFLGWVGEYMLMGRVQVNKVSHKVETTEEIAVPCNQQDKFSRMLGLLAIAG